MTPISDPAVLSPSFVLSAILLVVAARYKNIGTVERLLRLLRSRVTLALAALCAVLLIPRLYISYAAPCEILQDTIAARELIHHRSAYPVDLHTLVNRELDEHPPRDPLADLFPRLKALRAAQESCARNLILNAHPPFVAVALVPAVMVLGIYAPAIIMNVINLLLIPLIVRAILLILEVAVSPAAFWTITLLVAGWQPVLSTVRMANQSLIISALVVSGLYTMLGNKTSLSSLLLALAFFGKLYPGLLLVYAGFSRERFLRPAMLIVSILSTLIVVAFGPPLFTDFVHTGQQVTILYGTISNNYSLLAKAAFVSRLIHAGSAFSSSVFAVIAIFMIAGAFWRLHAGAQAPRMKLIYGFCLMSTAMCLLSPVVWTHYYSLLLLPIAVILRYVIDWQSRSGITVAATAIACVSLHDSAINYAGRELAHVSDIAGDLIWLVPTFGVLLIFALLWRASGRQGLPSRPQGR